MSVIHRADQRRTETPNAVMTTLASPTVGGAGLALWRVEMQPGAQGPEHAFDVEQVWTVLEGAADVVLDGGTARVERGDTLVLAPGRTRQITADAEVGLVAMVTSPPDGRAAMADGTDRGIPDWIA